MSNANMEKKLSLKTLIGKIDKKELAEKHPNGHMLFRLFGAASGVKTGTSNYGDWHKFVGEFGAVKLSTGEVSRSPFCFIPEPAQGLLLAALAKAENGPVEFALEIGVKPNDSQVGYEYIVKSLVESKESDAVERLAAVALAGTKAAIGSDKSAPADKPAPAKAEPAKKK